MLLASSDYFSTLGNSRYVPYRVVPEITVFSGESQEDWWGLGAPSGKNQYQFFLNYIQTLLKVFPLNNSNICNSNFHSFKPPIKMFNSDSIDINELAKFLNGLSVSQKEQIKVNTDLFMADDQYSYTKDQDQVMTIPCRVIKKITGVRKIQSVSNTRLADKFSETEAIVGDTILIKSSDGQFHAIITNIEENCGQEILTVTLYFRPGSRSTVLYEKFRGHNELILDEAAVKTFYRDECDIYSIQVSDFFSYVK
jgi:hypothetical protein